MKLDKVREILLKLEADTGDPRAWKDIGGLVEAEELSSHDGYDWRASSLTYEGHELLDTVRDGKVWKETKRIATEAGVLSIRALMETATAVMKSQLLKHGAHLP